jgi:hypothetical protein
MWQTETLAVSASEGPSKLTFARFRNKAAVSWFLITRNVSNTNGHTYRFFVAQT